MIDEKPIRPLRRLSSMANWRLPSDGDWSDIEFDPYPSLATALPLTWADFFILCLTPVHIAAYAWFGASLLVPPRTLCANPLPALLPIIVSGWAIQLVWAAKAVYLMDKAAPKAAGFFSFLWRGLRTSLLGLPFSFLPAWVIGCLVWPFLRIDLRGGTHFYDFSLLIGQYAQNSVWYVGARQGSVAQNFEAFALITTRNRSRYWDTAAEQGQTNALLGGLVYVAFGILAAASSLLPHASVALGPFRNLEPLLAGALVAGIVFGCICMVVNTAGLGALSLLEYAKHEEVAADEAPLPVDARSRWLLYLPHAIAGVTVYGALLAVLVDGMMSSCSLPPF